MLRRTALKRSKKQMKPAMKRGKPLVQRAFPVTDPVDAPDGAVGDGFVRSGDQQVKRSSGLKRSTFKRKPRNVRASDDPVHLAIIRSLPCHRCGESAPSEPHHPRDMTGMGLRAPDRDAFPLCDECHRVWLHDSGVPREERRAFQREAVERYRQLADFPVVLLVRRFNPLRWSVFGAYATDAEAERVWESSIRGCGVTAWSWWGARYVAAKMVTDPHYVPEPTEQATGGADV